MRARGVVCALLLLVGCAGPRYFVRPSDVSAGATPAIRDDGTDVQLRGGSFRLSDRPARADGRVPVHGPGRHGVRYQTGAIVLGTSLGLAALAAGLTVGSIGCVSESCRGQSRNESPFWAGFAISIFADAGWAIVGPALMVSGGWERPAEVR
jgi:hypothetical protein